MITGELEPRSVLRRHRGQKASKRLGHQRHVLVDPCQHRVIELALSFETRDEALQITRHTKHQPRDQELHIASIGPWREQQGLVCQIVQLQRQLGQIVALGVKRKRLRKHPLESFAGVAFEAHLASVERVGETEGQLQPLEAQREARETVGGGRHRLKHRPLGVLARFVVGLDAAAQELHALRHAIRQRPAGQCHTHAILQ